MNIFTIAPNDQSVNYLATLFGSVGTVLTNPNAGISLIGTMFQTFNTMALTIAGAMVVYITVMGVLSSASEGEFMGKKFTNMWVPIRMVFGIAGLVPVSGGYCTIQIIIMWIVLQGVGAADSLWNTVLNYVNQVGSPFATNPPLGIGTTQTMNTLFQDLVCQASAKNNINYPYANQQSNAGNYYCGVNTNVPFCQNALPVFNPDANSPVYQIGPSGNCGQLNVCDVTSNQICTGSTPLTNSSSLNCAICKAQRQAMLQVMNTLAGVAQLVVNTDYSYRSFYDSQAPGANVPQFVSNYCAAQNITQDNCCHPVNSMNEADLILASNGQKCPLSGALGDNLSSNNVNATPTDMNNTLPATASNLYWPYAISPAINGLNFIQSAAGYYQNSLTQAMTAWIAQQPPSQLPSEFATMYNTGWIFAGAYYYKIAKVNNSNAGATNPTFTVQGMLTQGGVSGFRNNFETAQNLLSSAQGSSAPAVSSPQLTQFASLSNSATASVMSHFTSMLTGGGQVTDPLSKLQAFGAGLLIAAQVIFFVWLALALMMATGMAVAGFLMLGTGISNLVGIAQVLFMLLNPLIMVLLGFLVSLGGLLGVYVPLIPYIVFTVGAIGWLLATVEAMVAGPIIALGILSPGGDHEIMGRAKPAIDLLLNLFLRPSLMVFGLMTAMLLAGVVITMINAMFAGVISNIQGSGGIGLLELILYLGAYVSLVVTALNKCFSLIGHLPDRILSWIGGTPTSYGEAGEALSSAQRGVEGAGGAALAAKGMTGGAAEGGKALGAEGTARADRAKADKDKAKKGAPNIQQEP